MLRPTLKFDRKIRSVVGWGAPSTFEASPLFTAQESPGNYPTGTSLTFHWEKNNLHQLRGYHCTTWAGQECPHNGDLECRGRGTRAVCRRTKVGTFAGL
jgi:hypothetical protein